MGTRTVRVPVKPEMLRWARERAGLGVESLRKAFPNLEAWEGRECQPTVRQLERYAARVRVPFGYLFFDAPPDEPLPIPDLRTMTRPLRCPSPDLLDTIYACQQRQEWYRGYRQSLGANPHPFVGSACAADDPTGVAADIRGRLEFDIDERRRLRSWTAALRRFIEQTWRTGILVMTSGVVGSNTHRQLDPEEFRGFALADPLVPLIFVNAADTKAAQMFTLAHELGHVWLGASGVSDVQVGAFAGEETERWCNRVAAELLVPMERLKACYCAGAGLRDELDRLAHEFKVSTLVVLRRLYEMGEFEQAEFRKLIQDETARLSQFERRARSGGDFYRTLNARVSKPFAEAVVISALEGTTLFRDACQLLGIRKVETFHKLARELGIG